MATKASSVFLVSPKYSTAAAADELSDPMSKGTGVPRDVEQIRLAKIRENLPQTSKTIEMIKAKSAETLSNKLANTLAQGAKTQPTLSASEGWVILPATFEDDDYHVGWYMIGLAKLLGLSVYLINYDGPIRKEFTQETERMSEGIFISIEDFNRDIRVKVGKKDPVELGRTIVRAQQTIRLFTSPNLGMEALKKDQFFFGNNPGERMVIDKTEIKVKYSAKTLDVLFKEESWSERLRTLLLTLIRESARLLSDSVVTHAVSTNLLTRDETILTYCASTVTVTTGKGRKKKEEKVKEIPKRPKPSPLISQTETQFIDGLAKNIFKEPNQEEISDWPGAVSKYGFPTIREQLKHEYAERRTFREAYARITTSRLKDFRKLKPELRYKKKKDITGVDLDALLESRENREANFASEISFLDPHFSKALAYYREEVKKGDRILVDTTASRLKIQEDLRETGVYSGISTKKLVPQGVQLPAEQRKPMELPKSFQGVQTSFPVEVPQQWAEPTKDTDDSPWDDGPSSSRQQPSSPINKGKEPVQTKTPTTDTKPVSEPKEVKPDAPVAPSRSLDKQIMLESLDNERRYLDSKDLPIHVRVWVGEQEIKVAKNEGHLASESTFINIVRFCTSKIPVTYRLLPNSTGKWWLERNVKAYIVALRDQIAELKEGEHKQVQELVINRLRELVTDPGSVLNRAISSQME